MEIKFKRNKDKAIIPSKNYDSDAGYDVTIIEVHKDMDNVRIYTTGLSCELPPGYYFELFPRSSMTKLGVIMPHSVGIIDNFFRGEIMVPLLKVNHDMEWPELPCKIAQLIPKKMNEFKIIESTELSQTERGSKGFGSSGI